MTQTQVDELADLAPAADLRPLERPGRPQNPPGSVVPGLLVTVLVTALAVMASARLGVSSLVLAVLAGAIAANVGLVPRSLTPGTKLAARQLLRVGVVLLGLRLSLGEVAAAGVQTIGVVVTVVTLTFVGTRWLGQRMGVSPGLSLLIATGFSICGASAVAAMDGVSDAEEEESALAIGLVTLFGTLAIVVLPLLRLPLGLDPVVFGQIAGASVHDVAQVIATAATAGETALQSAIIVKLTRVITLAPMVAIIGLTMARRRAASAELTDTGDDASTPTSAPPLIPWFVGGFLVMVIVRSVGVLPMEVIDGARQVETLLLTAAMFGLGVGVDIARLRRLGGRPVLLAAISWAMILVVSYVGFAILG